MGENSKQGFREELMQHLTIAYMSNRIDCKIQWFWESLHRELSGNYENIKIVVIDFWADGSFERMGQIMRNAPVSCNVVHTSPKPTVWQGKHRLTKEDYFAASNARNTAICLAPDGWIAFVDDLSVLLPGWFDAIKRAMENNYIVLGAYKKVKGLEVVNGNPEKYTEFPGGIDSRLSKVSGQGPHSCDGGWMFGCSLAAPVDAFLKINGFDEACDGLGAEDYIAGIMLEKQGYKLMYDPRMMTFESDELHFVEKPFKRTDKGVSPNDKSHAILNMVRDGGRHVAPNFFPEGGIAALRQKILAGGEFPTSQIPFHDWFDGQPIQDF